MKLSIETTKPRQVVEITQRVRDLVLEKEFNEGVVSLVVQHTTAALTTADLDPGTDLDMLEAFEVMVQKLNYRHPHDPTHVGDHIMATLIGPDVSVHVTKGELVLGQWQAIVLVEFSGPRKREISVKLIKAGS